MSVLDYTGKIKSICDLLGSISINVNEDEMVQVCSASHNGSTRLGRQSWREINLLRSATFNQCYWLKRTMSELRPRRWKDICSSQFVWWMRTRLRRQNRSILPISRRELKPSARRWKPSRNLQKKGGASFPNKVGKPGHLPATSVGRLATTKRSAERRRVIQHLQADNS